MQVALNLALCAGLLMIVMTTAAGDLVEHRRSFRVVFVMAMVLFGIAKTVLYLALSEPGDRSGTARHMRWPCWHLQWLLRIGRCDPEAISGPRKTAAEARRGGVAVGRQADAEPDRGRDGRGNLAA